MSFSIIDLQRFTKLYSRRGHFVYLCFPESYLRCLMFSITDGTVITPTILGLSLEFLSLLCYGDLNRCTYVPGSTL